MPAPVRFVVFGDSVPWGQGLRDEHKYYNLVAAELKKKNPSIQTELVAHSGAVIGLNIGNGRSGINGEVPVSYPTIWQQCTDYTNAPEAVDIVLLNGGINDVDIRTILSPFTDLKDLRNYTWLACHTHMKLLLLQLMTRFTKPTLQVVLTGYYPILSKNSEFLRFPPFLDINGIGLPPHLYQGPIFAKIVECAVTFWNESNNALRQAVLEAGAESGAGGRITFIATPFTEQNSVFADDPLLFGLNADFSPQDEVSGPRELACDLFISDFDIAAREQCYRASAGHPNVKGSQAISKAILGTLM